MMVKHHPKSIVYVDCDAVFLMYPALFDILDCDVAAFEFDRTFYYGKKHNGKELLSGTLFFKNTDQVRGLISRWEDRCKERPGDWDQRSLQYVIKEDFFRLPAEYCTIIDTMKEIKSPVILHYQASRKVRKNGGVPIPIK